MVTGAFRFPSVSCSQCGHDFGPGDSGFSSCHEHQRRPAELARKTDAAIQRTGEIAKDMGVRMPTAHTFAALPRWAVTVLLVLLLVVLPAISLHLGDPDGFDRAADMAQRSLLLDELEVQP